MLFVTLNSFECPKPCSMQSRHGQCLIDDAEAVTNQAHRNPRITAQYVAQVTCVDSNSLRVGFCE